MSLKRQKRSIPKSSLKSRTQSRIVSGSQRATKKGTPGQEQDIQRRLGNFTGKGEHARVGTRTSGIGGQTSKTFRTDNKRTKSTKPKTEHGKGSR